MASVFYYLVMFMLYTMMVSNNHLHCEAASLDTIDYKCLVSINKIVNEMVDADGRDAFVKGPNGTLILNPMARIRELCRDVPVTPLTGRDLVLCKCKFQDLLATKVLDGNAGQKLFNALDTDKEHAKSCGFSDTDCDAAFRSVLTPCETKAREVMKTCAPMVKAAAEKDLGNRPRQLCCSTLNNLNCICSNKNYEIYLNSTEETRLNEFFQYANRTLLDKCGLSANHSACKPLQDYYGSGRSIPKLCLLGDLSNVGYCGQLVQKPQMQESELPLVDPFRGCCLKEDNRPCKCDQRSVSCCQKLGELSKNNRDSCMCELLKSSTTPDSTLEFLNFVRSNDIQITSCENISPVFTDSCIAPPPPPPSSPSNNVIYITAEDLVPYKLRKGFRTPNNPNP